MKALRIVTRAVAKCELTGESPSGNARDDTQQTSQGPEIASSLQLLQNHSKQGSRLWRAARAQIFTGHITAFWIPDVARGNE
jgi:hypothetical protein